MDESHHSLFKLSPVNQDLQTQLNFKPFHCALTMKFP